MDPQQLVPEKQVDADGGECAGRQRGQGDSVHFHMKHMKKDIVPRDVDHVHEETDDHADPGTADAPQQGGSGVIDRDKGDRRDGDHEIGVAVFHDVRCDVTEHDGQDRLFKNVQKDRYDNGNDQGGKQKLVGGLNGPGPSMLSQKLAYHDGTAGGKSRHEGDDQHHDGVHQGNSRNGVLADGRHHHGICYTNGKHEQLLSEQRPEKPEKIMVVEQQILLIQCVFFLLSMEHDIYSIAPHFLIANRFCE